MLQNTTPYQQCSRERFRISITSLIRSATQPLLSYACADVPQSFFVAIVSRPRHLCSTFISFASLWTHFHHNCSFATFQHHGDRRRSRITKGVFSGLSAKRCRPNLPAGFSRCGHVEGRDRYGHSLSKSTRPSHLYAARYHSYTKRAFPTGRMSSSFGSSTRTMSCHLH